MPLILRTIENDWLNMLLIVLHFFCYLKPQNFVGRAEVLTTAYVDTLAPCRINKTADFKTELRE